MGSYIAYFIVPFLLVVSWLIWGCDWSYVDGNLILGLIILGAPVIIVLILLGIGATIDQSAKGVKKLATTDYSPVENKREKLLDELEKEGDVSGEYTPWDHGKKED